MQNLVAEDSLYENSINLKVGDEVGIEKIKQTLISLGYERADLTEARGQFSVRGDIIDISKTDTEGIRIELENGVIVEGTPEHRVMLSDGSYKMLCELTEDDDIMVVDNM